MGGPKRGTLTSAGKRAWQWRGKDGSIEIVPRGTSAKCDGAFPVGRAELRSRAQYDVKRGGTKAFLVQSEFNESCHSEDEPACLRALVLRGKNKRYLSVAPIEGCAKPVAITPIRIFPGQPSAMVECAGSAGGDMYGHSLEVLHVIDGEWTSVVSVFTGYSSEQVGEREDCRFSPPGYIKVIRSGARPIIEILSVDVPTEGQRARLAWDGKHFVVQSKSAVDEDGLNKHVKLTCGHRGW